MQLCQLTANVEHHSDSEHHKFLFVLSSLFPPIVLLCLLCSVVPATRCYSHETRHCLLCSSALSPLQNRGSNSPLQATSFSAPRFLFLHHPDSRSGSPHRFLPQILEISPAIQHIPAEPAPPGELAPIHMVGGWESARGHSPSRFPFSSAAFLACS